MGFSSQNMHYIFNVEYFKDLNLCDFIGNSQKNPEKISERNDAIINHRFQPEDPFMPLRNDSRFRSFSLYTCYPGLLMGIGYPHNIAADEAIKAGFSLDYASGMPYYPGSSLKGLLRSYFSFPELIQSYLNSDIDVNKLKISLFERNNVFLGAYPMLEEASTILALEYITPHSSCLSNPNPISFMKVKPNVRFEFCFLLDICDEFNLSVDVILTLFKTLITEMGIGAKTNVGFGRMEEKPRDNNKLSFCNEELNLISISQNAMSIPQHDPKTIKKLADGSVLGPCPKCGSDVKRNGDSVECSNKCGIQFKKVMGSDVSDSDLSNLLHSKSIDISINDIATGKLRPARIYIDNSMAYLPAGKSGEKKGLYRPNYKREWLDN